MEKRRVLQGCSICEGGIWFHQGAVLLVADPNVHVRTVTDADGKTQTLPCTEPVTDQDTNTPAGITPAPAKKAAESPAPAKAKEK